MPKLVRKSQSDWRTPMVDWYMSAAENLYLVDWDHLSSKCIVPFGAGLNVIYWFVCVQASFLKQTASGPVFETRNTSTIKSASRGSDHWWSHAMRTLSLLFIALSVLNVWYCFTRTRVYQLHQKNDAPTADADENTSTQASRHESKLRENIAFWPFTLKFFSLSRTSSSDCIIAWDPSLPSLRLFSVFSPVHTVLIFSYSKQPAVLLLTGLLSLQTAYLVHLYAQHVADKQMIYGQVFSEYESTFVQPRLGVMKRDVGVGTAPDDDGVYVEVHTPKVGIVDARKPAAGIPKSANQIRMHEWERPVMGVERGYPASPNVWAQSPTKIAPSARRSIASPVKVNGTPAKMFRPAGWGSSSGSFSSSNPFAPSGAPAVSNGIKKSRTMSSLASKWD